MFANATTSPWNLTIATGNRARYSSSKNPSEKPFSVPARVCSQSSDTAPQCGHERRNGGRRDDLERPAILLETADRLTVARAARAFKAEGVEVDARFLADLRERQPEIRVAMEVRGADLVEDRHAVEVVATLQELPDQAAHRLVWSDRIAERHPGPPLHAIHDEAGAVLVEDQALVTKVGEVRRRPRLAGDDRARRRAGPPRTA